MQIDEVTTTRPAWQGRDDGDGDRAEADDDGDAGAPAAPPTDARRALSAFLAGSLRRRRRRQAQL